MEAQTMRDSASNFDLNKEVNNEFIQFKKQIKKEIVEKPLSFKEIKLSEEMLYQGRYNHQWIQQGGLDVSMNLSVLPVDMRLFWITNSETPHAKKIFFQWNINTQQLIENYKSKVQKLQAAEKKLNQLNPDLLSQIAMERTEKILNKKKLLQSVQDSVKKMETLIKELSSPEYVKNIEANKALLSEMNNSNLIPGVDYDSVKLKVMDHMNKISLLKSLQSNERVMKYYKKYKEIMSKKETVQTALDSSNNPEIMKKEILNYADVSGIQKWLLGIKQLKLGSITKSISPLTMQGVQMFGLDLEIEKPIYVNAFAGIPWTSQHYVFSGAFNSRNNFTLFPLGLSVGYHQGNFKNEIGFVRLQQTSDSTAKWSNYLGFAKGENNVGKSIKLTYELAYSDMDKNYNEEKHFRFTSQKMSGTLGINFNLLSDKLILALKNKYVGKEYYTLGNPFLVSGNTSDFQLDFNCIKNIKLKSLVSVYFNQSNQRSYSIQQTIKYKQNAWLSHQLIYAYNEYRAISDSVQLFSSLSNRWMLDHTLNFNVGKTFLNTVLSNTMQYGFVDSKYRASWVGTFIQMVTIHKTNLMYQINMSKAPVISSYFQQLSITQKISKTFSISSSIGHHQSLALDDINLALGVKLNAGRINAAVKANYLCKLGRPNELSTGLGVNAQCNLLLYAKKSKKN